MPAALSAVHPGALDDVGVLIGLCRRCNQANDRLPAGTRQKRLNAAARLAASDTSGRYWTARLLDPGAATLAAHMLGHPETAHDVAAALGWE
jgi:deferrochelatase/peroxidase EfeB